MKIVNLLLGIWAVFLVLGSIQFLWRNNPLLLSIMAVAGFFCIYSVVWNRYRSIKRGYKVTRWGGGDDLEVLYQEGELVLRFDGERQEKVDTLYVPDEAHWQRVMPEKVKQRREEIIERIYLEINPKRFPIFVIESFGSQS